MQLLDYLIWLDVERASVQLILNGRQAGKLNSQNERQEAILPLWTGVKDVIVEPPISHFGFPSHPPSAIRTLADVRPLKISKME